MAGFDKLKRGQTQEELLQKQNAMFQELYTSVSDLEESVEQAGKIDDVKVNGTSVVSDKVANITVPTKVSDLTNDSNFSAAAEVFQATKTTYDTLDSVIISQYFESTPNPAPKQGDIFIVTTTINEAEYEKSAYFYNDIDWVAMTGNVDASKVILPEDTLLAGNYTAVGNWTKTQTGTATKQTKGKSLMEAWKGIFTQEIQPTITKQPSISITLTGAGAKEVGTEFTPQYTTSFNKGTYSFKPTDTGVTVTSYNVTDTNSGSATSASGSFTKFTVEDSTNYKVNVTVQHTEGAIALTNTGNESNPIVKIAAGSKSASSSAVTGYRSWFNYVGTDTATTDGSWIRNTATNKGASGYNSFSLTIPAGTKKVVVAIPSSKNQTLKSVIDVDGMGLDVKGNFVASTAQVSGLNGYTAAEYNVWEFVNINGVSATTYNFTFGV